MRRLNSRSFWLVFPCLVACGDPPAPVERPPVVTAAASESVAAPDPPPASPGEPASLVLVVRARDPKATWKLVESLRPDAFDLADALAKRTAEASTFMDLSQPWDLGVVLDPQWETAGSARFLTAVSIPLSDVDGFLALVEEKGDSVTALGGGRHRIVSGERLRCEVWDREERARMVCSDGAPALSELGGWMALTLAAQAEPEADLTLRVRMAPLRAPFFTEGSRELDSFVNAIADSMARAKIDGGDLVASLREGKAELRSTLEDLEELNASLRLQGGAPELSISGTMRWSGTSARVTELLSTRSAAAEPPPEFWKLPKDAEVAFFGRGFDEKLLVGPRALARRSIELTIDTAERRYVDLLGPKEKAAHLAAFDRIPTPTGPWAFAVGAIPQSSQAATSAAPNSPKAIVEAAERTIASSIGWSVFAGEGDAATLAGSVKAALESADALVKVELAELTRNAGTVVHKGFRGRPNFYQQRKERLERTAPKWKVTKDPVGYPKGSTLFQITFGFDNGDVQDVVVLEEEESSKPAKKPTFVLGKVPVSLVVVPGNAGRVLWGVSSDAETLKRKLLGTISGAAAESLGAREDLTSLAKGVGAGGFMLVGPTLARLMAIDPQDRDVQSLRGILEAAPNKAAGRATFTLTGDEAAAPTMRFSVTLDRGLTSDALGLLLLSD